MLTVTPSESAIFAALRSFLLSVLPAGQAQYKGSIAGNVLTVASMLPGSADIALGDPVLGVDVAYGTYISEFGTGTGGAGTYTVSFAQTVGSAAPEVLASGVEVIQAQDNRVPEPLCSDYLTMTPLRRPRMSTNVDDDEDVTFTGSIDAGTLTVTKVAGGDILIGSRVWGPGVADGTVIVAPLTGSGGLGTYAVVPAQEVESVSMAAGRRLATESVQMAIQVDVYGPNSGNFAQMVSAMFRDGYAVDQFAAISPAISPLYADDPRQLAFSDGEQQYENRWSIDVELQIDQTITVPQQFADTLKVSVVNAATGQ
jgi:hypothetical protein